MKWVDRVSYGQVALGSVLAMLGVIGLGSLSSCGQSSSDEKAVTLNATDDRAARAALDKQGDMLAQAADRAASGGAVNASTSGKNDTLDAFTAAKMNLETALKDADSAKYRNLFVSRLPGGNLVLCGEVNSKNGFGAYTGFKGFIAHPDPNIPPIVEDDATGMGDDVDTNLYPQARQRFCNHPIERF